MGKLTAKRKAREYNRGKKAAREGRSRSWSEPWAYTFESNQHYEERREAFNQGYGINRRHAHVCPAPSSVITISRSGCRRRTWVDSGPKASTAVCFETQLTAAPQDEDERLKGHQHGCQGSQILGRRSRQHAARHRYSRPRG